MIQVPSPPPTGMTVAAFDAATNQYCSWAANTKANVPDSWRLVYNFSMEGTPEGISAAVIVLASSIAVTIGFYILGNDPKMHV